MSGLAGAVRRVLYRAPGTSAERAQRVRDVVVDEVESAGWDPDAVEAPARAAMEALKDGDLPEPGTEIETYLAETCRRYRSRGYTHEDLKLAMDGLQARISARRTVEETSS